MERKEQGESDGPSSVSEEERANRTAKTTEIGRGSFGRILVSIETAGLAFKQLLNPQDIEQLQMEFEVYRLIVTPLKRATFKVPKPLKFFPTVAALQARYDVTLDSAAALFSMRFVPSVSVGVRSVIRDHFVNDQLRPKFTKLRLCRLYLGLSLPSLPSLHSPLSPISPSLSIF